MKNQKLISKGDSNAKTIKNSLETHILYLMPHTQNSKGINICTKSSKGCENGCLVDSGMALVYKTINEARSKRTELYINNRTEFCERIYKELFLLNKKAVKKDGKIEVRLNGTSDLDFIAIIKNRLGKDILSDFPNLIFYDYTKIIGKILKYKGQNYVLTFSRSEINEADCKKALSMGANVSVVFDHKKPFPKTFLGAEVIDGDKADDIMIEAHGKILGLKAKGLKAKSDITGFVVR
jgi:hypothetical protein